MAEISSYWHDILNVGYMELPWSKLSGSNILITGATGLIGSCLVDVLMNNPHRDYTIYAAGRNMLRAESRFYKYIEKDGFKLLHYDVTKPVRHKTDFDIIIHAASNASPNSFANNPVEVMKSNFNGVSNLIEYGLNHNMKRLLYVSSGEVYGQGDGRVLNEDYSGYVNSMSPRSCYPSSKRSAETLCASYGIEYGANIVVARPSHVYGPYFTESDNRVYAQFIRNVIDGQDIIMKSSGSQYRSWCYVVDCVSALLYILLKGKNGEAYNIADSSSSLTIKELAELIASIGHRNVKVEIPTEAERKGYNPVTKSIFDTTRLENLGWYVEGTIREKMSHTIKERMMFGVSKKEIDSQHEENICHNTSERT